MMIPKASANAMVFWGLLSAAAMQLAHAGGTVSPPPYGLVSSVRSGRTTFDYSYTITVNTDGAVPTSGVATVTSSDPATQVLKGTVVFGCQRPQGAFAALPNQTYQSRDTFTIRQDRTKPFNPKALSWIVGLPSDKFYAGPAFTVVPANNCDPAAFDQIDPPAAKQAGPFNYSPDKTFLSGNGTNTAAQACAYYVAVGALPDTGHCDATTGVISSDSQFQPMTFDGWRQSAHIDGYAVTGAKSYGAVFINKVDLNLTREHSSVSYGDDSLSGYTGVSAYVCNHRGPSVLNPSQSQDYPDDPSIDTQIGQIVGNLTTTALQNGKNLIACVAMDYRSDQRNGPYVRLLLFIAPQSGEAPVLSTAVDLDGRGAKFMPGSCTGCHGGDATSYASGNTGTNFLPYDTANFEYSTQHTALSQEGAFAGLNANALLSGAGTGLTTLIKGWYAAQTSSAVNTQNFPFACDASTSKCDLSKVFVPAQWNNSMLDAFIYRSGYARACRTCHVVNATFIDSPAVDSSYLSCSPNGMPHSLVTFNRFWSEGIPGDGRTYQPALIAALNGSSGRYFASAASGMGTANAPLTFTNALADFLFLGSLLIDANGNPLLGAGGGSPMLPNGDLPDTYLLAGGLSANGSPDSIFLLNQAIASPGGSTVGLPPPCTFSPPSHPFWFSK